MEGSVEFEDEKKGGEKCKLRGYWQRCNLFTKFWAFLTHFDLPPAKKNLTFRMLSGIFRFSTFQPILRFSDGSDLKTGCIRTPVGSKIPSELL